MAKNQSNLCFWIAIWGFSILGQGSWASGFPKSCSEIQFESGSNSSQLQVVYPDGPGGDSLEVLCDFETDGGGWTIIQKRTSGPKTEFMHSWNVYASGFGSLVRNFWLGLDNIHALTKNRDQELRIQLEDFEGNKKYAKYSNFSVSDGLDFYRLTISGFVEDSTAGDSMIKAHSINGMRFSTPDVDNDKYPDRNCADFYGGGGWWFYACSNSNLNGLYHGKGENVSFLQGIYWETWKGWEYPYATSEMKIRTSK